jgi:dolichol-phosphate mannosyltransferase
MTKLISIIIPVHNEEQNILPIYQALIVQFKPLSPSYDYEIIFINDGSKDDSQSKIEELIKIDPAVKYLEFSRNFGKEMATTAGLHHAQGQAAIIIDCDLQHPPELINEFIAKWRAGADMVIGLRQKNQGEGLIKKIGSMIFYAIMNIIGESKVVFKATDFRLIDRKVIDEFNRFTEHDRITRGLLDWLGFKKDYIYFKAQPRLNGKTAYSPAKLLKLATSAFVSHSMFPLKLAGYLGILIIIFSGPLGLFIFVNKYLINDPLNFSFSGPAILATLNLFLVGIILSCLGLISLYIANIQNEVVNRPNYVIRSKINFNDKK